MTVRELAAYLAGRPEEEQDLIVVINGWGSDEGLGPFEVSTGEQWHDRFMLDYTESYKNPTGWGEINYDHF